MLSSQKILVSPLDWGLGHASRLLPIVQDLSKDNEIIVGVNNKTRDFIKQHISDARFVEVPSYKISYSSWGSFWSFLRLVPQLMKSKKEEEKWVHDFLKDNKVDLIVSDSRFGFRHPSVKSVIISHQLKLQLPPFWNLLGKKAQEVNDKWLSAFDEVWVPDKEDHQLSGDLSMGSNLKTRFIGVQSRFERKKYENLEKVPYILCIVSGPEPQRSQLEHIFLHQAPHIDQKVIIVGGKPEQKMKKFDCANACWYPHLETEELAARIVHADLVISRSGYSSLMDYYRLGCKNLFLIPTPGQTEQIYLAKRMKENGISDFSNQKNFNLSELILTKNDFSGFG